MALTRHAKGLADIVDHIKDEMWMEGRSHLSRGMKSPHKAYVAAYNQALADVVKLLESTTLDG